MNPQADWIPAFIQGGAFIVVAWVVVHLMTKNLPQVTRHFADTTAAQQAAGERIVQQFLLSLAEARGAFREELKEIRSNNDRDIERILQALEQQNRLILLLLHAVQRHPLTTEQEVIVGKVASQAP